MNRNIYKQTVLVMLSVLLICCGKDDGVKENVYPPVNPDIESDAKLEMTINATLGIVDELKMSLPSVWNSGEVLSVFNGNSAKSAVYTFTINGGGGEKTSVFKGELPYWTEENSYLYFTYPIIQEATYDPKSIDFDLSGQTAVSNISDLNSSRYEYKYGSVQHSGKKEYDVTINYAVSLIELNLTLPDNSTSTKLKSLYIKGSSIHSKAKFDLSTDQFAFDPTQEQRVDIDGEFIVSNNAIKAYVYLFPGQIKEAKIFVEDENGKQYQTGQLSSSDLTIQGGYVYTVDQTLFTNISTQFENESDPNIDGSNAAKAYIIANAKQLELLASRSSEDKYRSCYYKLSKDIDLTEVCGAEIGSWTPIGSDAKPFSGNFDGGGYTISNLYMDSEGDSKGLFESGVNAVISNVIASGFNIKTTGSQCSAIIGQAAGGDISNCTVENGTFQALSNIGGIAGYAYDGNIVGCKVKGITLIGTTTTREDNAHAGGIMGLGQSLIAGCTSQDCTINGGVAKRVGGIAGNAYGPTVGNLVKNAILTSLDYVGAVAGLVDNASNGRIIASVVESASMTVSQGFDNRGVFAGVYIPDNDAMSGCYYIGANVNVAKITGDNKGNATSVGRIADIDVATLNSAIASWNNANAGKQCNYKFVLSDGNLAVIANK